ncbi:MAG: carboxypeptidase regulatory-like domain-containing protein [Proteobacteria bacterium]|nr:carboxypeptidase regulatory-like domain-containing protein [Pseudomonadota bacterium]
MTRTRIRSLILTLFVLGLAGCAATGGGKSNVIEGVILDAEDNPIAMAEIRISPEDSTEVVGMGMTNAAGRFTIVTLANTQLFTEEPLRKDTTYQARIQVPGFYILEQNFEYGKGTESWEFELEMRETDDIGDGETFGGDSGEGGEARSLGGAVRRTSR